MQWTQFRRENMNNYFVIPCSEIIERDSYFVTVLELIEIPELMNCQIREIDGVQYCYYPMKYRTPLKQVLGNLNLTYAIVHSMLCSVVRIIECTEEYLLCIDNIFWNSESIFVEVSSGKLAFTYYPLEKKHADTLTDFLMEIIQYVDKKEQQVYLFLMEFYNLVTNPNCDLKLLKEYVHKNSIRKEECINTDTHHILEQEEQQEKKPLKKEMSMFNKNTSLVIAGLAAVNIMVVVLLLLEVWNYQYIWVLVITLTLLLVAVLAKNTYREEESTDQIMEEYKKIMEQPAINNFQQKQMAVDEYMETTLLTEEKQAVVIEDKPQELYLEAMCSDIYGEIHINQNSVVVGSMKEKCDCYLSQEGISRMHAKLVKKEDGLYLLDLNSTNGTFLNNELILGGKEYLLMDGDEISFAKVAVFTVRKK